MQASNAVRRCCELSARRLCRLPVQRARSPEVRCHERWQPPPQHRRALPARCGGVRPSALRTARVAQRSPGLEPPFFTGLTLAVSARSCARERAATPRQTYSHRLELCCCPSLRAQPAAGTRRRLTGALSRNCTPAGSAGALACHTRGWPTHSRAARTTCNGRSAALRPDIKARVRTAKRNAVQRSTQHTGGHTPACRAHGRVNRRVSAVPRV